MYMISRFAWPLLMLSRMQLKHEAAIKLLEDIAAEIRQSTPADLFPDPESDPQWQKNAHGQKPPSSTNQQLRALSQASTCCICTCSHTVYGRHHALHQSVV